MKQMLDLGWEPIIEVKNCGSNREMASEIIEGLSLVQLKMGRTPRNYRIKENKFSSSGKQIAKVNLDETETLEQILTLAVDMAKVQIRNREGQNLAFLPNKQKPFTGWIKNMYANGQVKTLFKMKEGRPSGTETHWYENGQKKAELELRDGIKITKAWLPNGEVDPNGIFGDEKKKAAQTWVNSTGVAYVEAYNALVGEYPKALTDLLNPPNGIVPFIKIESDLHDPWDEPYLYENPGSKNINSFDLSTTAPDGSVIGNW